MTSPELISTITAAVAALGALARFVVIVLRNRP